MNEMELVRQRVYDLERNQSLIKQRQAFEVPIRPLELAAD